MFPDTPEAASDDNEMRRATESAKAAMDERRFLDAFYCWIALQQRFPGHPEAYQAAGVALRALRATEPGRPMALERVIAGGIPLDPAGSIAIVGNSPNVAGRGYGPAIDSHDTVVRINRAWNKLHPADLGMKTDVLFLGHFPAQYIDDYKQIVPGCKMILSFMRNWENLALLGLDWGQVFFINSFRAFHTRGVYKALARYLGPGMTHPRPPRSGITMLGLMMLLGKGEHPIDIYGMEDRNMTGANWREHLHSDGAIGTYSHLKFHCPVELEFEMLQRMKDKGLVRIHT